MRSLWYEIEFISDPPLSWPQLWKLDWSMDWDKGMLLNKGGLWKSNDMWNFNYFDHDLIHVENINKTKVWGATNDGKVILEDYVEGKADQLWRKRECNAEGYVILEDYNNSSRFVTAASSTSLELRGNITL